VTTLALRLNAGKWCAKCGKWKPRDEYHSGPHNTLRSWCKECARAATRAWRAARSPERKAAELAARRDAYREAHPLPTLACSECGVELERPYRVVCSRRCKDRRYARLHPEKARAKAKRHWRHVAERRKAERQAAA